MKIVKHVVMLQHIHTLININKITTLCGRDTVQYKNADISQEILLSFLERNHIQHRTNLYMTMFRFREYRIVAFSGGRF